TNEVSCFERYTLAFCNWLKQIETLNGREISLVKLSFFNILQGKVQIVAEDFRSCDFSESNVTLGKVSDRLNSPPDNLKKLPVKDFGRLLRFLYEACRAS
ncbi:MAG: hypothetical protein IJG32_09520, partial [Selenomonadaceae bacterium]|nr:hypothetical protein [Selenomonadaceae bacterium]